jgi:hypothetical protein
VLDVPEELPKFHDQTALQFAGTVDALASNVNGSCFLPEGGEIVNESVGAGHEGGGGAVTLKDWKTDGAAE